MSKVVIEDTSDRTTELLRAAVAAQIERLLASIGKGRARLQALQNKYGKELAQVAAEDLEGGDLEYVDWAGEVELLHRLEDDLDRLKRLEIAHQ